MCGVQCVCVSAANQGARKLMEICKHARKRANEQVAGKIKALSVFVSHNMCVCVEKERDIKKKNPTAEKVAGVGREQNTRVCIFIHNSWSDMQGGFQRALMRCINTYVAAARGPGSSEGRRLTMTS